MRWFIFGFGLVLVVTCLLLVGELIHTEVIYRNMIKLNDAVFRYWANAVSNNENPLVTLDDIPPITVYFDRPFVWTIKQMLPSDKYELIKPYIDRR